MTTIALAIPHCPWDSHRVKSLARIKQALEIRSDRDTCDRVRELAIFAEVGPTPNWVWSKKMFDWMALQTTDYVMQVQDDIVPCPRFWDTVHAALEGIGPQAEVISLYTIADIAAKLGKEKGNWMTSTDWMTGPTWICKTSFMREFVDFRENRLREGWIENIPLNSLNEDTLLGLGAAALGRRVYNPIPALVDHDTMLASQNNPGRKLHKFDRASFSWKAWAGQPGNDLDDLTLPDFWRPRNPVIGSRDRVPHFGLAYSFTPWNFVRWVKDDGKSFGGLPWGKRADQIRFDVVQTETR